MKKRWICLFVENDIGTLARISSLFSGKGYNIDSLTVGATEDSTISRMTIGLTGDDRTCEQIKKQLNRAVEVIKVADFTDKPIYIRELLLVKVKNCSEKEITELIGIAQAFGINTVGYDSSAILLECVQTEDKNNALLSLLTGRFPHRVEAVRGGSAAIEGIN